MATQPKLTVPGTVENPADHVPDRWRKQFESYLSTGQGTPDFFEFLDHDPAGQRAVESALTQRANAFDHFTAELKRAFSPGDAMPTPQDRGAPASRRLTRRRPAAARAGGETPPGQPARTPAVPGALLARAPRRVPSCLSPRPTFDLPAK